MDDFEEFDGFAFNMKFIDRYKTATYQFISAGYYYVHFHFKFDFEEVAIYIKVHRCGRLDISGCFCWIFETLKAQIILLAH